MLDLHKQRKKQETRKHIPWFYLGVLLTYSGWRFNPCPVFTWYILCMCMFFNVIVMYVCAVLGHIFVYRACYLYWLRFSAVYLSLCQVFTCRHMLRMAFVLCNRIHTKGYSVQNGCHGCRLFIPIKNTLILRDMCSMTHYICTLPSASNQVIGQNQPVLLLTSFQSTGTRVIKLADLSTYRGIVFILHTLVNYWLSFKRINDRCTIGLCLAILWVGEAWRIFKYH